MAEQDKKVVDDAFEGLYLASGVTLSPAEKQGLREVYDLMAKYAERVRRPGRTGAAKPLPHFTPSRKASKP